jgi:hypothetical protein
MVGECAPWSVLTALVSASSSAATQNSISLVNNRHDRTACENHEP